MTDQMDVSDNEIERPIDFNNVNISDQTSEDMDINNHRVDDGLMKSSNHGSPMDYEEGPLQQNVKMKNSPSAITSDELFQEKKQPLHSTSDWLLNVNEEYSPLSTTTAPSTTMTDLPLTTAMADDLTTTTATKQRTLPSSCTTKYKIPPTNPIMEQQIPSSITNTQQKIHPKTTIIEHLVVPSGTTTEQQIPSLTSVAEQQIPSSSAVTKQKVPPSTTTTERQIPSSASITEKKIPPSTTTTEQQIHPSASITEQKIPPSTTTTEQQIPSSSSVTEQQIPPSTTTTEQKIPPSTIITEQQVTLSHSTINHHIPPPITSADHGFLLTTQLSPSKSFQDDGDTEKDEILASNLTIPQPVLRKHPTPTSDSDQLILTDQTLPSNSITDSPLKFRDETLPFAQILDQRDILKDTIPCNTSTTFSSTLSLTEKGKAPLIASTLKQWIADMNQHPPIQNLNEKKQSHFSSAPSPQLIKKEEEQFPHLATVREQTSTPTQLVTVNDKPTTSSASMKRIPLDDKFTSLPFSTTQDTNGKEPLPSSTQQSYTKGHQSISTSASVKDNTPISTPKQINTKTRLPLLNSSENNPTPPTSIPALHLTEKDDFPPLVTGVIQPRPIPHMKKEEKLLKDQTYSISENLNPPSTTSTLTQQVGDQEHLPAFVSTPDQEVIPQNQYPACTSSTTHTSSPQFTLKDQLYEKVKQQRSPETTPKHTLPQQHSSPPQAKKARIGNEKITAHGMTLTALSINTLRGSAWLDDNVVNLYLKMIQARSMDKDIKVMALKSHFIPQMESRGYDGVKGWAKKIDIFADLDFLLIPINTGAHWVLICVQFRKDGVQDNFVHIYYYNSFGPMGGEKYIAQVEEYLNNERMKRDTQEVIPEIHFCEDVPRQYNGSDCGVFICQYAEFLSRGYGLPEGDKPFPFKQENMPHLRKIMLDEILNGNLDEDKNDLYQFIQTENRKVEDNPRGSGSGYKNKNSRKNKGKQQKRNNKNNSKENKESNMMPSINIHSASLNTTESDNINTPTKTKKAAEESFRIKVVHNPFDFVKETEKKFKENTNEILSSKNLGNIEKEEKLDLNGEHCKQKIMKTLSNTETITEQPDSIQKKKAATESINDTEIGNEQQYLVEKEKEKCFRTEEMNITSIDKDPYTKKILEKGEENQLEKEENQLINIERKEPMDAGNQLFEKRAQQEIQRGINEQVNTRRNPPVKFVERSKEQLKENIVEQVKHNGNKKDHSKTGAKQYEESGVKKLPSNDIITKQPQTTRHQNSPKKISITEQPKSIQNHNPTKKVPNQSKIGEETQCLVKERNDHEEPSCCCSC